MEKFVRSSYVVILDKSFKMLLIQFWTRLFSACHELIVLVSWLRYWSHGVSVHPAY